MLSFTDIVVLNAIAQDAAQTAQGGGGGYSAPYRAPAKPKPPRMLWTYKRWSVWIGTAVFGWTGTVMLANNSAQDVAHTCFIWLAILVTGVLCIRLNIETQQRNRERWLAEAPMRKRAAEYHAALQSEITAAKAAKIEAKEQAAWAAQQARIAKMQRRMS